MSPVIRLPGSREVLHGPCALGLRFGPIGTWLLPATEAVPAEFGVAEIPA